MRRDDVREIEGAIDVQRFPNNLPMHRHPSFKSLAELGAKTVINTRAGAILADVVHSNRKQREGRIICDHR